MRYPFNKLIAVKWAMMSLCSLALPSAGLHSWKRRLQFQKAVALEAVLAVSLVPAGQCHAKARPDCKESVWFKNLQHLNRRLKYISSRAGEDFIEDGIAKHIAAPSGVCV